LKVSLYTIGMSPKTLKRKHRRRVYTRKQRGRGFFTSRTNTQPCTADTTQIFKDARTAGETVSGCDEFAYRDEFLTPERKALLDSLQMCPNRETIHQQVKNAFVQSCEQKSIENASKLKARAARVRKMKYGTNITRRANLTRQEGKRNLFTL
jgi:hypothetical protein